MRSLKATKYNYVNLENMNSIFSFEYPVLAVQSSIVEVNEMIYVVLNKSGSCIYGALRTEKGAREQIVSSSTSNYQPHDNNKSHMPMVPGR